MYDTKPWESHPALTEKCLQVIADIIRNTRHDAIQAHEPNKGDSNWGLGCRVHERTCHAIMLAANDHDWLDIIEPGLHFVFSIGGVPIRFYRGEPENPNPRYLSRRYPEIQAQQYAFDFAHESEQWLWRLAIETDYLGEVLRIVFVEVAENGDIRSTWEIPQSDKMPIVAALHNRLREPVELEPPVVSPRQDNSKIANGE